MVKGISRQVILVKGGEEKLFEQAIFIIREGALGKEGVTDRELLRQADRALHSGRPARLKPWAYGTLCGLLGGGFVGLAWILTAAF